MQKFAAGKFQVEPPSRFRSLDHLVRAGEHGRRNFEPERFSGLEIDHRLVLVWRLNRQVGWLLALEDAIDVAGRAAELVREIGPIGDETAAGGPKPGAVGRG